MTQLTITDREEDRVRVLVVAGEIDVESAPRLSDALARSVEEGTVTVLDFRNVSFIDSTGLTALVTALQARGGENDRLRLVGLQANPRRVFEITGLLDVFDLYDDLETASSTRDSANSA